MSFSTAIVALVLIDAAALVAVVLILTSQPKRGQP